MTQTGLAKLLVHQKVESLPMSGIHMNVATDQPLMGKDVISWAGPCFVDTFIIFHKNWFKRDKRLVSVSNFINFLLNDGTLELVNNELEWAADK